MSCTFYACIKPNGAVVTSRLGMALRSLGLLASVHRAPGRVARLRAIVVHLRHLLTRRVRNDRIGSRSDPTALLARARSSFRAAVDNLPGRA